MTDERLHCIIVDGINNINKLGIPRYMIECRIFLKPKTLKKLNKIRVHAEDVNDSSENWNYTFEGLKVFSNPTIKKDSVMVGIISEVAE